MDLMQLITSQLSGGVMDQLAQQVGGSKEQTQSATQGILSTLIGAMAKNTAQKDGAAGLFNALEKDHDGSLLDNIGDFLNPEKPNPVSERATNGIGILNHLLGDKGDAISKMIGQQSGLSQQKTMGLMSTLAPILMATLGKQKQQQGFDVGSLVGLLSNNKQNISQNNQLSGFMRLLDMDGDGSAMDDAMGILGKLFGRKK